MATFQDCSIGISVPESTYKTYVAPTRFYEFISESVNWQKNVKQGQGLRVGSRVPRSGRRFTASAGGAGTFQVEWPSKGGGLLLQAALGGATSTVVAATTAYQQVFTLADVPPSFTLQKGIPRVDQATVDAYTFLGCMVGSLEFSIPNSDLAQATFNIDAGDMTTAQGYVAPTYTGSPVNLFPFTVASISLGGTLTAPTTTALATVTGASAASVRSASISINNNLNVERYNLGGGGRKAKPTVGMRAISGSMTLEYDSVTYRDAFLNETDLALLINLVGTTNAGTGRPEQLQIACPNIRFDTQLPEANGGDLITVDMGFTVLDNTVAAQPIWITQTTSDTAL